MIGGKPSGPGWFPFMVALTVRQGHKETQCSGFIVSPTAIMSAAHCFPVNHAFISAKLGNVNRKKGRLVRLKAFVNPKFNHKTHINDISILKPINGGELPLGDTAKAIALEGRFVKPTCALAMGWGKTTRDTCVSDHGTRSRILLYHSQQIKRMGRKKIYVKGNKKLKTCMGDSGSPLVEMRNGEYVALAILSTGNAYGKEHYTRILPQKAFILEHANDVKFVD